MSEIRQYPWPADFPNEADALGRLAWGEETKRQRAVAKKCACGQPFHYPKAGYAGWHCICGNYHGHNPACVIHNASNKLAPRFFTNPGSDQSWVRNRFLKRQPGCVYCEHDYQIVPMDAWPRCMICQPDKYRFFGTRNIPRTEVEVAVAQCEYEYDVKKFETIRHHEMIRPSQIFTYEVPTRMLIDPQQADSLWWLALREYSKRCGLNSDRLPPLPTVDTCHCGQPFHYPMAGYAGYHCICSADGGHTQHCRNHNYDNHINVRARTANKSTPHTMCQHTPAESENAVETSNTNTQPNNPMARSKASSTLRLGRMAGWDYT